MASLKTYVFNVLLSLDFLLNAFIGGQPAETLTKHAARSMAEGKHWGCIVCRLLELVDKGHCRRYG